MDTYKIKDSLKSVVGFMKSSTHGDIQSFGSVIDYITQNNCFRKVITSKNAVAYKGYINIDGLGLKDFLLKESEIGEADCLTLVASDLSIYKSLIYEGDRANYISNELGETKRFTFRVTKRGLRDVKELDNSKSNE